MRYSNTILPIALQALSLKTIGAKSHRLLACSPAFVPPTSSLKRLSTRKFSTEQKASDEAELIYDTTKSPWAPENNLKPKKNANTRFRQHVNPLARKYQMETELSDEWPNDGTFVDPSLPLHIDVGCGKGGFLLELGNLRQEIPNESEGDRNYLGLELRPSVAKFAKGRVARRGLAGKADFIGCNANVDMERIVSKYATFGEIALVSIQYPDPHYKKSHQKRRVVTEEFMNTLSKHLKEGNQIFIQSDVKDVLDNMRETILEFGSEYFVDLIDDPDEYMEENPLGVPTEREVSVLDQDLPVYRTIFRRTGKEWQE